MTKNKTNVIKVKILLKFFPRLLRFDILCSERQAGNVMILKYRIFYYDLAQNLV